MPKVMEKDATVATVAPIMKNSDSYVANIRHLMVQAEKSRGPVAVRVGVTGQGLHPSFRLETLDGVFIESYDGVTFRPFGDLKTHGESWSINRSNLQEITELLTKMRNYKSKKA